MRSFGSLAEFAAAKGHLGYSAWREVTQKQVDTFADATDDHQWIHVDPDRAAGSPFGGTIAHGYRDPGALRRLTPSTSRAGVSR
jgi:acyl dehydratase